MGLRLSIIKIIPVIAYCIAMLIVTPSEAAEMSGDTEGCIDCHRSVTPGIVSDWETSRHASVTVSEALAKAELERRVSSDDIPDSLKNIAIGCAECHQINAEGHPGTFDHLGYPIHTVVSPADCAVCHGTEWEQYQDNLMSHAHTNLVDNLLYSQMRSNINGVHHFDGDRLTVDRADDLTGDASCLHCHGTRMSVYGTVTRETDFGEMEFAGLTGWPNQGVGRINPDGTSGACTSCHPRHRFSIEVARKPYACSECHKGPDVPAYKVYKVSKHGNIYDSERHTWEFNRVPWVIAEDFSAPTCAVCHISLVIDNDENIIAKRTHRMNDRLDKRLFGLIYSHPHPKEADLTDIVNKAGLPLPTELTGEPVMEYLIDSSEQAERRNNMKNICMSCHSGQWTDGHFAMLDKAIETTNEMTLAATEIMTKIWQDDLIEGLPQGKSIFDDYIERRWVEQWLFYSNSVRFAAAMNGADYGVFANGRWYLTRNLREIHEWYKLHKELK